ncbi:MAG: CRISPR-associated endonuclease Cas1 [Acidobacteria bacterium]|nr:CRISPR-associated endonuclease Cas1 [Acidobacteriota bacterium]
MFAIEFDRYLLTLRLRRGARFHFNHGGVLRGLLSAALRRHDMPVGLVPFACESGRVTFEPGDLYRIGLTFCSESRADARTLLAGLARAGNHGGATDESPAPVLGGNYDVVSAEQLPQPELAPPILSGTEPSLTIQFVSPFRLERLPADQIKGARHLNAACFPVGHFLSRLWNRLFLLAHGRYPGRTEREKVPPLPPACRSDPSRLLWLDVPVDGVTGKDPERPHGYTLGGVVGRVVLDVLPVEWLSVLVLGQHVHGGENTHFGFGKYRILGGGTPSSDPFRPAESALDRACSAGVLNESLRHLLSSSVAAGVDGVKPGAFQSMSEGYLCSIADDLRAGSYHPDRLAGFVSRDRNGKLRPLAIPTVRDRVAQRAVCAVLGPAIDSVLEDCAYAYRKGFSRRGAATAIAKAYDAGFRYVLDADISSFFDTVDWSRLFAKIDALFPAEPLVALIEKWVKAAVLFEGRVLERTRGLPQGSPISPLLANLFLDEFDEELLGQDYRLVRYADDFVVLCKDLESAHAAQAAAQEALGRLGLDLHPEKTNIRSFDSGFTYLGYLFCRSVIMESNAAETVAVQQEDAPKIPPYSWLAQAPLSTVRTIAGAPPRGSVRRRVEIVPLGGESALRTPGPKPLYVLGPSSKISVQSDCLIAVGPDNVTQKVPVHSISHVVLVGRTRATLPLFLRLIGDGVPVYLCRRSGELISVVTPHSPDWPTWEAQGRFVENPEACAAFVREVAAAKLNNSAALCVRYKLDGGEEAAAQIREMSAACANKSDVETLRGFEGKAAALFFACLKRSLSEDWGFQGRKAHPATDPVNAMLSFGYTLLYNHLSTALIAAGLNPRIGIFHAQRGAYHALACDLQEEFRHLIDALVWAGVSRREVTPADFIVDQGDQHKCFMSVELRRDFIQRIERRLLTAFRPGGEQEELSYRAFMDRQARQVKELVTKRVSAYIPLRIRP